MKQFLIVLIFAASSICFAQTNEQIKKKNAELDNLRSDIKVLEKELSVKNKKEKESLSSLQKIKNQNHLLTKLINRLKREERSKSKKISNLEEEIKKVDSQISTLKNDYSKYVVWLYKYGSGSTLKYLFEAESINQAAIRYQYLSSITDENEKRLTELNTNKEKFIALTNQLENEIVKKEKIVKSKRKEQNVLSKKKNEKQNIIDKIKRDKSALNREIEQKRKAEEEIKNLVAKLIEEEIASRENESKGTVQKYNYDTFENFSVLKGRMNWPVNNGKVVRRFGKNKNRKLNTVTINYGVDIKTKPHSEVHAVAEGVVSAIEWIPGFGSVVILTHKGNYRTVYGHIKDITVVEGEKIKGGKLLGRVNESLEGNIIHFEIWNQRKNQNPETWLAKK